MRLPFALIQVWPFCFVGLRHLERAAQQTNVSYNLTWEPFLLNPSMDEQGEDLREHIIGKYGPRGASMIDDPNNHLMQSGRAVGINFVNERKIYPTLKVRKCSVDVVFAALWMKDFIERKTTVISNHNSSLLQTSGPCFDGIS